MLSKRIFIGQLAIVVSATTLFALPAVAQDLRYPQLEKSYQERTQRQQQSRSSAQTQPAPRQQPGRPFVRLPFFGNVLPRSDAPPPRWPAGQQTNPAANVPVAEQKPLRRPAMPAQTARKAPETVVAVIGDQYAQELAQGLTQLFANQEETAFVSAVGAPGGGLLVPSEETWIALAKQVLERKSLHAVVFFIGAIPENHPEKNRVMEKPLALAEAYSQRMDKMLAAFEGRDIPVIWVGLPPVADETLSKNNALINSFIWQKISNRKGLFVDVWEPFVNENGLFSADGLDEEGAMTRLRTPEGRYFTRAGRRKMASYVATNIRIALARTGRTASGLDNAALSKLEEQMLKRARGAEGLLLIGSAPVAADGALASYTPPSPSAVTAEHGTVAPAPSGRADDYSWPRR